MEKSLSDSDISKYIPTVIKYSDIERIDPERMLKFLPVVILYETSPNVGHWTLLHRLDNGNIEFFDSYGMKPDEQFKMISSGMQLPHYLMNLLKDLRKYGEIHYNQYGLQKFGNGINTCGRWVILRHLMKEANIDQFAKAVEEVSKAAGISPDELVVRAVKI